MTGVAINIDIGLMSYSIAAVAFLGLAVWLLLSWRQGSMAAHLLTLACAITALWAGLTAAGFAYGADLTITAYLIEHVRNAAWLAVLGVFLVLRLRAAHQEHLVWVVPTTIAGLVGAAVLLDVTAAAGLWDDHLLELARLRHLSRVIIAVGGLLLVENVYRNAAEDERWSLKPLCLGLGGLYLHDFVLYADGLLFLRINPLFFEARGLTNALVMPLIALSAARSEVWSVDMSVSRRVAFHSTSILVGGIYLLFMAALGYYLREYGGHLGAVLQITLIFASLLFLAALLFSGWFRGYVRIFLNKHFFSYKYDYREEWQGFIRTISTSEPGQTLHARAIKAVADIVDSPGGALWIRGDDGLYREVECWNFPLGLGEPFGMGEPLARFLDERRWIVNLRELEEQPERYDSLQLPAFLDGFPRVWLVVPLLRDEALCGFILLENPRAPRDLNWEDFDLLKIVGQQVASYLAEQAAEQALYEARQFEMFNRRFAFVLHDIKNLVSQLSLLVANAEKHAENPQFQRDMILTVSESVAKMKHLLTRLHGGDEDGVLGERVELLPLLEDLAEKHNKINQELTITCDETGPAVVADRDRIEKIFGHLVQNAVEAAGEGGKIDVRIMSDGKMAVVDINDSGPGMDMAFIRSELFRPFKTTKAAGYGIGAYESRQIIEAHGGRLEVFSTPGEGTTMSVRLPLWTAAGGEIPAEAVFEAASRGGAS